MSNQEKIAEWNDAIAALCGCPGRPTEEMILRVIACGDALAAVLALTDPDSPDCSRCHWRKEWHHDGAQNWVGRQCSMRFDRPVCP